MGVIYWVEGREGRLCFSKDLLVPQAPRGTWSGAEAAPSHACVPKTSPHPPGPPCPLGGYSLPPIFMYFGCWEPTGSARALPQLGGQQQRGQIPGTHDSKQPCFPENHLGSGFSSLEAAGKGLGRGDGSTPDLWPQRDLPPSPRSHRLSGDELVPHTPRPSFPLPKSRPQQLWSHLSPLSPMFLFTQHWEKSPQGLQTTC